MQEQQFIAILRAIDSFSAFFNAEMLPILKAWWWLIPPIFLFKPIAEAWIRWRQSISFKSRKYVLLEIKLPVEMNKPLKAMENVFDSIGPAIVNDRDPGKILHEKWFEGESTFYPSLSFEIVSFDGSVHFFARIDEPYRDTLEAILYSQYSDIQIQEVADYTDNVPQDIPNKEWNLECRGSSLARENAYPIKTYEEFGTEMELREERKVDPLARLLEGLASLKKGEQFWVQFVIGDTNSNPLKKDWQKEAKKIRDELAKREKKEDKTIKRRPIILQAIEILLFGPSEEKEEEETKFVFPSELRMTPGEQQIVKAIERKISKWGFDVTIRWMYLAKREAFFKPHLGLVGSFFASFSTGDLNYLGSEKETTTKVKTLFRIFDNRFSYMKKRRAFRLYKMRVNPAFPDYKGTSVLNTEEMATMFHFPSRLAAPAPYLERLETRKGEAPPGLPIEEEKSS